MSWTTRLEVIYFNKRINGKHEYKTEFFGDAQWKQAANEVDQIIRGNGTNSIHSIYLGSKYCHWHLDDGTVLVPDECRCQECRPDLYAQKVPNRPNISREDALRVLLIEKKNDPGFVRFVSA